MNHYLCVFLMMGVDTDMQTYYHSHYHLYTYLNSLVYAYFEEYLRLVTMKIPVKLLIASMFLLSREAGKRIISSTSITFSKSDRVTRLLILISRMTWKLIIISSDKRMYKSCRKFRSTLLIALFPLNCFPSTRQISICLNRSWRWWCIRISAIAPSFSCCS